MARRKKVYGFTISLWEEWDTVPSLFRQTAEFKEALNLASSALWKAMMEPSWLPYPLRPLMSLLPHRDQSGDAWSGCHYWSNFEIADLDFFRGKQYQAFFKALDDTGGFYFERVSGLLMDFLFSISWWAKNGTWGRRLGDEEGEGCRWRIGMTRKPSFCLPSAPSASMLLPPRLAESHLVQPRSPLSAQTLGSLKQITNQDCVLHLVG